MSVATAVRTRVFISYSHKDSDYLEELQEHLGALQRRELLDVWVDTQIEAGDPWREEIQQALDSTKVAILLVSPAFLNSAFITEVELPQLLKAAKEEGVKIFPVALKPSLYDKTELKRYQLFNGPQHPLSGMNKTRRGKIWVDLAKKVMAALNQAPREKKPPSSPTESVALPVAAAPPPAPALPAEPVWHVQPVPTPFFIGRGQELERLRKIFTTGKGLVTQALTGLGGMGKTQTALAYAYSYRQEYQTIFWAQAENREVLFGDMTTFAALLKLPAHDYSEQTVVVGAMTRWLEANSNWLLILDNVNDLALVREVLPRKGSGHILLTTQTQALGGAAQDAHLRELLLEDAQRLLLRRAGVLREDEALAEVSALQQNHARALAEELGRLPLALDQAGAYLADNGCGLKGYLDLYRDQRAELLRLRGNLETDQHEAVATTWTLAFRQLEQTTPAAIELLRLCAFLHPEAIPEDLFRNGGEDLPPALQEAVGNGLRWNEVLAALRRFSLIEREGETQTLSVHRLVQAVLRDELPDAEQRAWAERAVRLVNRAFPAVKFETWEHCQKLLPHALVCADHLDRWQIAFAEAARLLDRTGHYLAERVRYGEAQSLLKRGLAMREDLLGPDHLDVAISVNNLGELYRTQGQYPEALPLFQRALSIREAALESNPLDVALSLNNLGLLYHEQGLYAKAVPLYQQALVIRKQALGLAHRDTARSLNNLAALYQDQGQYTEALPLHQQSLAIMEQSLGPTHPDTAQSLNNLAGLYQAQGQYVEALPLFRRALAIREQALGPTHPDVAYSLNNLAVIYRDLGQYAEALLLHQRALEIGERVLGPMHPGVAYSLNNLALLYDAQGQYAKALALMQRALAIREQALGLTHPLIAATLGNLAGFYVDQGPKQYVRALSFAKRAVEIMEQVLPNHPDTAAILMNLAGLLRRMGQPNKAAPLEARARAIRAKQGLPSEFDD